MKTNKIKRIESITVGNKRLVLEASLDDDCKNGYADFSFTYNLEERNSRGRYEFVSGGCASYTDDVFVQKMIKKWGLEALNKVTNCDFKGCPSHTLANGLYFLKEGQVDVFQRYLRLTDVETEVAKHLDSELGLYVWLLDNGVIDRWKEEADEAIRAIINGRDIEFESDARKPNGCIYFKEEPTEEMLNEEREKIKNGYYSKKNQESRAHELLLKEIGKQYMWGIECQTKGIEKHRRKIRFLDAILAAVMKDVDILEDPLACLKNVIYYDESGYIGFNTWINCANREVSDHDIEIIKRNMSEFINSHKLEVRNLHGKM